MGAGHFASLYLGVSYHIDPELGEVQAKNFLDAIYTIQRIPFVEPQSVVLLCGAFITLLNVQILSVRNALWIGHTISLNGKMRYVFYMFILTFYVFFNGLPRRLFALNEVAKQKYFLSKGGFLSRLRSISPVYAHLLGGALYDLSTTTRSLFFDRGFDSRVYSDSHISKLSAVDLVFIVVSLCIALVSFIAF